MYRNPFLAIDIGGTSVKYGEVSHIGEISNKSKFEVHNLTSLEEFLEVLHQAIKPYIEDGITKVGISSLGIFNKEGLCLGGVENMPFLEGANLAKEVMAWNSQIKCHIMNDGVAAAMGEYWFGEGQGCQNFICITLGTGIGGAIVLDGKPLLGSHFQSGEIGYSNYDSETDYLELGYSTKGVLEEAARRMHLQEIDGFFFVEQVKKKEPICSLVFQEWMTALAKVLANSILLLDPEKIIIGGGISGQKEWLCNGLNEKLQLHLPLSFREKVTVCAAKHGNDAGLLGAVTIFIN